VSYLSDTAGNVVVSHDGVSGIGLGRPWLPVPFVPLYGVIDSNTGWPVTTSGSFVDLLYASHEVQHRHVMVDVDVVCGEDTTAEVQILDGATAIGAAETLNAGVTTRLRITAALASSYTAETTLYVQGRRVTGAASVWVQVAGAWGVQTPLA
jgi:hypothetical protein